MNYTTLKEVTRLADMLQSQTDIRLNNFDRKSRIQKLPATETTNGFWQMPVRFYFDFLIFVSCRIPINTSLVSEALVPMITRCPITSKKISCTSFGTT